MRPLAVVVVTYRSRDQIDACLGSVRQHAPEAAVVVADSASGDGTADSVAARFPHAELLRLDENRGFGAAVNAAALRVPGHDLLLLNPDAALRPQAAAMLQQQLYEQPDIGAIGPRILAADGGAELSWGAMVSLRSELLRQLQNAVRATPPGRQLFRRGGARDVDWVSGACMLVARDAWDASGGMDEQIFLYFEDVDLCARIRAAGRRVRYFPAAEVTHIGGASTARNRARVLVEYRRSQLYVYRKHHGAQAERRLRRYLQLRLALARAVALIRGRREEATALAEALDLVRSD